MGWKKYQMCNTFADFRPVRHYGVDGYNFRLEYKKVEYGSDVFVGILTAERQLRELVQRLEKLQGKLFKGDDKSNIWRLKEEVETLGRSVLLQQHTLYKMEGELPAGPLKQTYDSLRRNPRWYCRPELVEDCIARGGCSSRGCGCCESRHFRTSHRGVGHCTIECGCCSDYRGFEATPEMRKEIADGFQEMLYSPNPAFLLRMTEAYFSEPMQPQRQTTFATKF